MTMATPVKVPAYLHKIHRTWPSVVRRRESGQRTGPFVLLVSGSRDGDYGAPLEADIWEPVVENVLRMVAAREARARFVDQPRRLRHGAARGIDLLAARIAPRFHWLPQPYPVAAAEWNARKDAGHRRNARMVDDGVDLTVAFLAHTRSNGTRGCATYSAGRGVPTVRITWEDLLLPHLSL